MHWYTALFFNFLSSITAIVGFFIGASVGLESQEANGWMLAVASGTFIYIALVDLVGDSYCSVIHTHLHILHTVTLINIRVRFVFLSSCCIRRH